MHMNTLCPIRKVPRVKFVLSKHPWKNFMHTFGIITLSKGNSVEVYMRLIFLYQWKALIQHFKVTY